MLTRAARRRNHIRYAQSVAECIQLPFLCPSLSWADKATKPKRSIASRPSVQKLLTRHSQLSQSRQLASAVPLPEAFDRNDDLSSFAYGSQHLPVAHDLSSIPPSLPSWDPSNILHIDATIARRPERNDTSLVNGNEIRGNTTEVERNFEACLLLKKWPRAFTGLRQLRLLYHTDFERLRYQYNRVLAHLVDDMIASRNSEHEETISQWIDRDMKQAGMKPNAYTLALVIKAALSSSGRSKRERTVRRYWDMSRRYGLQAQVGDLRDILSDRDLGMISEICPLEADDWRDLEVDGPEIDLTDGVVSERPDLSIKETDQKGMGMTALKQTLALFSDAEAKYESRLDKDDISNQELATERQKRLETDAINSAINRWKIEHEKLAKRGLSGNMSHGQLGALLWQWHEILTTKIMNELQKVREAELRPEKSPQDRLRLEYGPFLELMKPGKLAAVTAIGLVQIMSKFGSSRPIKLVQLVVDLGKAIESEHQAEQKQERIRRWNKEPRLAESFTQAPGDNLPSTLRGKFVTPVAQRSMHPASTKFLGVSEWTTAIHAKLGSILCELMFDTARITITKSDPATGKNLTIAQPVFIRKKIYAQGKAIGAVTLHESFVQVLSARPATYAIAKQLPMLCPPRPWTGFKDGAYLESDQPVLRVKNGESLQKDYVIAAASRGDLDQLFAGLDVLGGTAWKINSKVFEVMVQAWNSGEAIANLPPISKVFDYPERPLSDAPRKIKFDWYQRIRAIENEKGGIHSERCFQNFQMEIAKAYLGETFYLPHNVDFRGRAYPIPPYLNQMGADNCRGLLLFARGRELGDTGLRWLKIHLSNVFGFDKASLSDRAQFPMDHITDIRDSVVNPLGGRKWWLTAEDPWQCLATCIELVEALDSPNPAKFVSHLPVHQDGSCNGLQHYAALGGDMAGAKQVNLEPGAKPADVYSGVADLVKAEVAADAAAGDKIAKALEGRISRKMVKQTVMTNVYGVTFMGALRQVRRQIDDLHPDLEQRQISGTCAAYVARKIFKALGSLFTGAHEIQYWLGDCANRITASLSPAQLKQIAQLEWAPKKEIVRRRGKTLASLQPKKTKTLDAGHFRSSVVWTTPLKLPVVQPYRISGGQKIITSLQHISLCEPSLADAVNRRKQLQAFPPNYIHSLDATHMMLSALKAHEMRLSFAAVHDSFWTHAADVNTLSQLLREAFIRMHSENIIGRLAAEFRTRYQGHLYLAQVVKKSPLGQALQEYRQQMMAEELLPTGVGYKTMAAQKHAELLREIKKRQLMESEHAQEREQGEAMVTAATIFEQYNGETYIDSQDSLGATAIGSIPQGGSDSSLGKEVQQELVDAPNLEESPIGQLPEAEATAVTVEYAEVVEGQSHDLNTPGGGPDASIDEEFASELGQEARPNKPKPKGKVRRKAAASSKSTFAWLPLTFRPVPEKGDFDVNRLRESLYFFS